jgi:m7GpppX diphosphatase
MSNKYVLKYYDAEKNILESYRLELDINSDELRKHIKETKILTSNDRHSAIEIEGEMVIQISGMVFKISDPDIRADKEYEFVFKDETYEEYLLKIASLKENNYRWIYNIIEGKAETEKVLYENKDFVLIPDYGFVKDKHDKIDINKLHILGIVRDKSIMSIRDITIHHIPMLQDIKKKSLECIETLYNIKANKIKIFYHYHPSTFLLHIHFTHISKLDAQTSFDRCHDFDQVIRNIQLDPSYYRGIMKVGMFI